MIGAVPLVLQADEPPPRLEVRGEIYMSRADFEAFNAEARAQGDKTLVNPVGPGWANPADGSWTDPRFLGRDGLDRYLWTYFCYFFNSCSSPCHVLVDL